MIQIDSPQNPRYRTWLSLLDGRGIRKARMFLLAGLKTVPEALARWPGRFTEILVDDPARVDDWVIPAGVQTVVLAKPLFRELDVSGTHAPILVGTVPEMARADLFAPPRGLELVCALSDPNNLGALLRSAASFGVARVILLEEAANPFHPRATRAASNAMFELDLARGPRFADLGDMAGPVFALDAGGEDLSRLDWPADLRLILGEEGQGVPASLDARRLTIPTTGSVESLNATVAASIALYGWYSRR